MGRLDELPLTEREIKGPPGLLARPTPIITSSTLLAFCVSEGRVKKGGYIWIYFSITLSTINLLGPGQHSINYNEFYLLPFVSIFKL